MTWPDPWPAPKPTLPRPTVPRDAAPAENPKTGAGLRKLPLDLIPPIALVEMAAVLGLGADCPAKGYGRWNWRDQPVEAETYVAALERHMLRWRAGKELDEQTGVSHRASAMCCLAILRDAQEAGTLIDNRRGSLGVLTVMDRYDASSMPLVKAA
ncbi:dATP/dGTP diphosphohydrolase domain-containing protein [Methylobacterium komagatae]